MDKIDNMLEDLIKEIDANADFYNGRTIGLFNDFLNDDLSVFDKRFLKYTGNANISNTPLFKKIALYNTYKKIILFAKKNCEKFNFFEENSLIIFKPMSDNLYVDNLITLAKLEFFEGNSFIINFYKDTVIDFSEHIKLLNKKEEALLSILAKNKNKNADYFQNKNLLEQIKQIDMSRLEKYCSNNQKIADIRNYILDEFLKENKLALDSDFIHEGNIFKKEYCFGSINVIEDEKKHYLVKQCIFR